MPTETLTIPASQAKAGDVITLTVKADARESDKYSTRLSLVNGWMCLASDTFVTVARTIPDPCPRGRMGHDVNDLYMCGFYLRNILNRAAIFRRVCALWNEAEAAQPYRETAEIEAGS